jgi:hypothetical protein
LSTRDTRGRRPLIFLAVLVSHLAVVLLAVRTARTIIASPKSPAEPLILMILPRRPAAIPHAAASGHAPAQAPAVNAHRPRSDAAQDNAITVAPEAAPPPPVDWDREAEVAAESALADAEREQSYRNLAALSPAQLDWIKRNRMEPSAPGIEWTHPRVQFDRDSGLPVIWINEHCVLVTLLVFCRIGHIESNGNLFKHMRDPGNP